MNPPPKTELLEVGLRSARGRLDDARLAMVDGEEKRPQQLLVSASLAEVLWWCVAFDDALGGHRRHVGGYASALGYSFRFARNAMSHGEEPWEAARSGLTFPIRWPISWGWHWIDMPEPAGTGMAFRRDQWLAYSTTLVGHDIDATLDDYGRELLRL